MKKTLRQLLVERRGGSNRVRILRAVNERPRNAHKLAEDLNLDYSTVTYHLDVLMDNGLLQCGGDNYGKVYLLSDQARHNWALIEELLVPVEQ